MDTASGKLSVLERLGFSPIGYFPLPEHCWLDNYDRPNGRHKNFVSYGYYIARLR